MSKYTVTELAAPLYGNTEAGISYKKSLESGRISEEVAAKTFEIIRSGECMVPITEKDDGCVDGRPAVSVRFVSVDGDFVEKPVTNAEEHTRAKVAGGGYLTAWSMRRAEEPASNTMDEDIALVFDRLAENEIFCGLHTGSHGADGCTDCGGNDKNEQILETAVLYKTEVTNEAEAVCSVASIQLEPEVFSRVFHGWSETLTHPEYFAGSTGQSRFEVIEDRIKNRQLSEGGDYPVSVNKGLEGPHKEIATVVNFIDGMTFSQALLASLLQKAFPGITNDQMPQVFVVDAPRIVKLAGAMSAKYPEEDRETIFQRAVHAGVAYQLATKATLSDNTLPTFVVTGK